MHRKINFKWVLLSVLYRIIYYILEKNTSNKGCNNERDFGTKKNG